MNLNEIIKKNTEIERKKFHASDDKNINYYYQEKLKRIANGEVVDELVFEEEEEIED